MGEDKASTFDGGLWGNVHQGSSFPPVPPMQEPDGPLAAKSCRTAMRLKSVLKVNSSPPRSRRRGWPCCR